MAEPPAPTSCLEHHEVRARGLSFHVVLAGPPDGPPVFLLHGFPDCWWGWHRVIGLLADAGRRVIVPDMRGYGGSDAPTGKFAYRLDVLADDVIALADALAIERFSLAGHDWGGIVGWALAAAHPDRVAHFVAVAAPHPDTFTSSLVADPRQLARSLYVAFFRIPLLPEVVLRARRFALLRRTLSRSAAPGTFGPESFDRYVAAWRGPGRLHAMLAYYRALRLAQPIGRVSVPTVILWGGRDSFLGRRLGSLALAQCDQARLELLANATHWIPHEHPHPVAQAILFAG